MPRSKKTRLVTSIKAFFGDTYPLVEHIVQMTAVFVVIVGCFFIARKSVPAMFPPGEVLSTVLHAVDTYASLLGTVGYAIWLTLEMLSILIRRIRRGFKETADE